MRLVKEIDSICIHIFSVKLDIGNCSHSLKLKNV